MADALIEGYEFKMIEAGCAPGSGRYGLQIDLANDISAVFPYLNALNASALYDPENHIFIWREAHQAYALRPREIKVARVENLSMAESTAGEIVGRINQVWRDRRNITPRFTERKLPTVIDVLRLLPRTNCGRCGQPTCLAYAAALRVDQARAEDCLPLSEAKYAENRRKLLDLLSSV